MDSTENQTAEMSREFKSRSKTKVILDGSEQILQNCKTHKVPTLLHQEENPNYYSCVLVVFHLCSINLRD